MVDAEKLNRYRFGTETAEFCICRECGVVPVVLSEIDGLMYAVVSVNAFDEAEGLEILESRTDFSGEETGARLERRKNNWISDVRLGSTPA